MRRGTQFPGQAPPPANFQNETKPKTMLSEREVQAATARGVPVPRHDGDRIPDPELIRGAQGVMSKPCMIRLQSKIEQCSLDFKSRSNHTR